MTKMGSFGLVVLFCGSSLAAASQRTSTEPEPKVQLFVSGLYQTHAFSFLDNRSLPLYVEEGEFRGEWTRSSGAAFGFGGSYEIRSGVSVGAAFEVLSSSPTETFEASLPHPLYFERERSVEGEAASLSYDEKALHILVSYTRMAGRFMVTISGGPSYFSTQTEIVDTFTFSESYPFDEAELESIQRGIYKANGLGFNMGGWVGYRLLDQLAVGADLRFALAKPSFTTRAGNEIEVDGGGFRVGAGIRLLF